MNELDWLRMINLIAFAALLVTGVVMMRDRFWRGWGVSVAAWGLNNVAFYAVVILAPTLFGFEALNAWSAVTKLQGAIMVVGGMAIVSQRRRLVRDD